VRVVRPRPAPETRAKQHDPHQCSHQQQGTLNRSPLTDSMTIIEFSRLEPYNIHMEIKDKSAIVTGGASGLGASTVRQLHSAGGKVVIADLNEKVGRKLAGELGPGVLFVKTDVGSESSMEQAVNTAIEKQGALHLLVNCAGVGLAEKILGKAGPHNLKNFTRVLQVNLIGTFNALRLSAAAMVRNLPNEDEERGVIINTASVAAFEGQIGQAAYAASKGGIAALTLPAARELARQGIRVVAIAPGIFDTPLLAALPEKARTSLGQQVPFPSRLGRPQEYATLVRHIIENVMLNGETIRLDGALRMAPR
jgi:NAD(P)-dependent dehydrogenase (short-subunit alcohol dehydrogenase family)